MDSETHNVPVSAVPPSAVPVTALENDLSLEPYLRAIESTLHAALAGMVDVPSPVVERQNRPDVTAIIHKHGESI